MTEVSYLTVMIIFFLLIQGRVNGEFNKPDLRSIGLLALLFRRTSISFFPINIFPGVSINFSEDRIGSTVLIPS